MLKLKKDRVIETYKKQQYLSKKDKESLRFLIIDKVNRAVDINFTKELTEYVETTLYKTNQYFKDYDNKKETINEYVNDIYNFTYENFGLENLTTSKIILSADLVLNNF